MRKTGLAIAGFEDGRGCERGCRQPLEAETARNVLPESLPKEHRWPLPGFGPETHFVLPPGTDCVVICYHGREMTQGYTRPSPFPFLPHFCFHQMHKTAVLIYLGSRFLLYMFTISFKTIKARLMFSFGFFFFVFKIYILKNK